MKTYIEKEVVQKENFIIEWLCDVCNSKMVNNVYNITTEHNDWGNDSFDSRQQKDICSVKCLLSFCLNGDINATSSTGSIQSERTGTGFDPQILKELLLFSMKLTG